MLKRFCAVRSVPDGSWDPEGGGGCRINLVLLKSGAMRNTSKFPFQWRDKLFLADSTAHGADGSSSLELV